MILLLDRRKRYLRPKLSDIIFNMMISFTSVTNVNNAMHKNKKHGKYFPSKCQNQSSYYVVNIYQYKLMQFFLHVPDK